jgi:hypothetical protein
MEGSAKPGRKAKGGSCFFDKKRGFMLKMLKTGAEQVV